MRRLLLVVLLVGAAWAGWVYETRRPVRTASAPPQSLTVPSGAGVLEIGRQLRNLGLVRHPEIFRAVVLVRRATGKLKAGEYSFEGELSLDDIVDKLARGDVVRRYVTFPEGSDLRAMAQIVAAQGLSGEAFLAAARQPALIQDLDPKAPDLEGYLFPDTYDVTRRPDAPAVLVRRMVQRFREVIQPELPVVAQSGKSLREIVTLASVVELETARPSERPRVAAVFLNRLRRRMPLQTDPTVIYALRKAGRYDGNIHRADLDVDSPYNTYRHPGLPPGPIASPGLASLQAALHPAQVQDIYFVSRNDGSHYFSETLAQHQRAVDHYQRGRGGVPPGDDLPDESPRP